METRKSFDTRKLVLLALLTAIVIVLQYLGAFIKFGPFSISLVLMPIVVGAALTGVISGGWLGLVFGFIVLISGDAAAFMAISPLAAVAVVLVKGALAGLAAGGAYKLFEKKSKTLAAIIAAAICPIVNTGVFALGVYVFFMPTVTSWGEAAGFSNGAAFLFIGMIGLNFFIELGINIILTPVIIRLVQYGQSRR